MPPKRIPKKYPTRRANVNKKKRGEEKDGEEKPKFCWR